MARPTVLRMAAINITVHPHPPGVYRELIKFVQRKRVTGKVHSDRHGVFGQVWESIDSAIPGVHGSITTFLQFDADQPWLDLETFEEATDEQLNQIDVPENLRPSLKRCRFVLDESTHLLIFDVNPGKGGMSPQSMFKFLASTFSDPRVVNKFGHVELNIVHIDQSVDRLFQLENISEIYIKASRPNTGDFDTTPYEDLEEFLGEQGADRLEQKLTSSGKGITPNKATVALARVADEYGYVEVKGKDDSGHVVRRSTKESAPLVEAFSYLANVLVDAAAQYEVVRSIRSVIRNRRRNVR